MFTRPYIWKGIKRLMSFNLLGLKLLVAFIAALLAQPLILFVGYLVDLIQGFYQLHQDYQERDLSDSKLDTLIDQTVQVPRFAENFDAWAQEQKEYYAEKERNDASLALLNKLLAESEVRQKDLLELADTSGYYQIFVYATPLTGAIRKLALEDLPALKREYPAFLKELGFARMGKHNSPCFLINKANLKEEKLRHIAEFKKFLMYHFKKVRDIEWNIFLEHVRVHNPAAYERAQEINFRELGVLQINFLLTQTHMNVTNIGYVDGARLGLGDRFNRDDINQQIFSSSATTYDGLEVDDTLKVKIKRIFRKQDVSLLLSGVSAEDRRLIESEQDSMNENLHIESVLKYADVSPVDLVTELTRVGVVEEHSQGIAASMITRAGQYRDALDNLRISIN